jgi:hypothetical protein
MMVPMDYEIRIQGRLSDSLQSLGLELIEFRRIED